MDWLSIVAEMVKEMGEGPFRLFVLIVFYFGVRELRRMRISMDNLHQALGKILEKVNGHEKRIRILERKKK